MGDIYNEKLLSDYAGIYSTIDQILWGKMVLLHI